MFGVLICICVAMEENLLRDNYWDQPPCRELEVPSRWSCLSGFSPFSSTTSGDGFDFWLWFFMLWFPFCVNNAVFVFVFCLWWGVENFWEWFLVVVGILLARYKKFNFSSSCCWGGGYLYKLLGFYFVRNKVKVYHTITWFYHWTLFC